MFSIPSNDGNKSKYFRNKHLFMDPFALTIAQWCYAHGWNTKGLARSNLGSNLSEMESSYWKYLSVWEKDEWEIVRNNAIQNMPRNSIVDEDGIFVMRDGSEENVEHEDDLVSDNDIIDYLVSISQYNPLEDTRPYYHASYSDIRGNVQLYSSVVG